MKPLLKLSPVISPLVIADFSFISSHKKHLILENLGLVFEEIKQGWILFN